MTQVVSLVTFVDIREGAGVPPSGLSFSARLDARLDDGRRLELLNDRGWTQSVIWFGRDDSGSESVDLSPWTAVTREQIEENARSVVGPGGAHGNYTQAEMDDGHWAYLAAALKAHRIDIGATELAGLPHEVEFGDQLLARLDDRR